MALAATTCADARTKRCMLLPVSVGIPRKTTYLMQRCLVSAFAVAFPLFFSASAEAVLFNDGAIHTIDAAHSFPGDIVRVEDGPGNATTTVNIVPGGLVGDVVEAVDSSRVNISGGIVQGGYLTFNEYAVLNMTGGTITGSLFLFSDHPSSISGGELLGSTTYIEANTQLDVTGGQFQHDLQVQNFASLFIRGGTLNGDLRALDFSTTRIFGSGFNFPLGDVSATSGVLTGTLADGTPLDVDFSRASLARITLTLIPEPATAPLIWGGLVALGIRRRRTRSC